MAPGSQSHESVWPSAQRESVWPGAQREFARVAERAARVRVMHRGVRHRLVGAPPRPGRARVRRQGLPALHRDPLLHDCRVPFAPRHPRLDRLVRLHQVVPERLAAARAHVRRWQVRRHRLPRAPARRAPATTSAAPSTAPPAAPAPGSPAPSRAARACSLAAAPSPRSPSTAATCAPHLAETRNCNQQACAIDGGVGDFSGHSSLAVDFMSFWGLPQRPSSIAVRPAASGARREPPPLSPPAVARAPRAAPRQHGCLQVGRSWHFLSDLEPSKEASSLDLSKKTALRKGL